MATVNWTSEAVKWLKDIYEYISLDNPDVASKVISGIYEKAQLLKDFPDIGYKYKIVEEGDIRILLYGHYRITYLVKNKTQTDILGVFHGALDLDRYLK